MSNECVEAYGIYSNSDLHLVKNKEQALKGSRREKRLRIATWNLSGLCNERKEKQVGEALTKMKIDMVAGQESWEKEGSRIEVEHYNWFGNPRNNQTSQRGEGGVGFLVNKCLVEEVEHISNIKYEESLWIKIKGQKGREAL